MRSSGVKTYHVFVDGEEEYLVRAEFHKAQRGARERGTGIPLEPDEPAGWEIDEVWEVGDDSETNIMHELDDRTLDAIVSYLWNY